MFSCFPSLLPAPGSTQLWPWPRSRARKAAAPCLSPSSLSYLGQVLQRPQSLSCSTFELGISPYESHAIPSFLTSHIPRIKRRKVGNAMPTQSPRIRQDLVHDSIDKISEPAALSAVYFINTWFCLFSKTTYSHRWQFGFICIGTQNLPWRPAILVNSKYLSVSVWLFQTNGIDPIPSARSPPRSDLRSPLGAPPAISITDSIADLMQVLLWKTLIESCPGPPNNGSTWNPPNYLTHGPVIYLWEMT